MRPDCILVVTFASGVAIGMAPWSSPFLGSAMAFAVGLLCVLWLHRALDRDAACEARR